MFHIKVTDIDSGKVIEDKDVNCIIGSWHTEDGRTACCSVATANTITIIEVMYQACEAIQKTLVSLKPHHRVAAVAVIKEMLGGEGDE